jgi:thiamine-phosphate pyrophosphorylase
MLTDERQSDDLWLALNRLPKGSGVVFRHYRLDPSHRRKLFDKVKHHCRRRRLLLLLAGDNRLARAWRADGFYGAATARHPGSLLRGAAVHDVAELKAAERTHADFIFISPVFATRSHAGGETLGRMGFVALASRSRLPVIALGGMNERRGRVLAPYSFGWAAIDAWTSTNAPSSR